MRTKHLFTAGFVNAPLFQNDFTPQRGYGCENHNHVRPPPLSSNGEILITISLRWSAHALQVNWNRCVESVGSQLSRRTHVCHCSTFPRKFTHREILTDNFLPLCDPLSVYLFFCTQMLMWCLLTRLPDYVSGSFQWFICYANRS